ncbi:MAG: multifunctional CCA tRNA nucleotidyl transferase/2'3'-cyclic phosphodiesterase/2'nucleotidase/phosphatase [Pseudomonadales bacterium]
MKIYLVGGAVRDELLGLAVSERDWVVVGATPEEMEALGYRQVGREFPVFLHPESGDDYALARTERKLGRGHRGFECDAGPGVTLEQDLSRRDLTINAIAKHSDGQLIDPYGGVEDLRAGLLRHVSPAFAEDPLRVLRVARFAARFADRNFRVVDETMALMRKMARSGELEELTVERVWNELEHSFESSSPATFLRVLALCEALHILFPELFDGKELDDLEAHPGFRALELTASGKLSDEGRFALLWLERSSEQLEAFAARIRPPSRFRDLAGLVVDQAERCIGWVNADPAELLRLLKRVDALRRPDRFAELLAVLSLAASSRGTQVDLAPLAELGEMLRNLDVSDAVEAADNDAIGERVDVERLGAIRKWLERRT